MHERLPPTTEPWLPRRRWRRLALAYAAGRITRAELSALKRRLARAPAIASTASRPRPALRLLPGGPPPAAAAPSSFPADPLEAA